MSISAIQRRIPSARHLWATLKNDPIASLTLGIFVATSALYALPLLTAEQLSFVSRRLGPFVFLCLVVFALRWNLGRIKAREDREFWYDLLGAFMCWWAASALILFFPRPEAKPFAVDFATSVLYALYYVGLLMALERQPHRRHRWRPLALERSLAWPAASAVVIGLFLYFPFIAVVTDRVEYRSGIPDLCLYLALDAYLTLRWIDLCRVTSSLRWRLIYALLAASTLSVLFNDLVEAFGLISDAELWHWETFGNVALYLPYLLMVSAARLRHHPFPWEPPPPASRIRLEENLPGPLGQTMTFLLLFPLLHFGCYELGVLGEASLARREVFLLTWLPILGVIGVVQYRILERALEDLKRERQSSERALHKTQKELRLAQERQVTDEALRASYERFTKAFQSCPEVMAISRVSDGLFLEVNQSIEQVFGYAPEDFLGRTSEELRVWLVPEQRARAVKELEKSGRVTMEAAFRTKSGEERLGLFFARLIDIDETPHMFSITRDITDEKERQADLRDFVAAIERADAAIWALDQEGCVSFRNEAAERSDSPLEEAPFDLRIPLAGEPGASASSFLMVSGSVRGKDQENPVA